MTINKIQHLLTSFLMAFFVFNLAVNSAFSQTGSLEVDGSLQVNQDVKIKGNQLSLFTPLWAGVSNGVTWNWSELPLSGHGHVQWNSSYGYTTWEWNKRLDDGQIKPQMSLSNMGVLTLYTFDTNQPMIVMDTQQQFITINGSKVVTEANVPIGLASGYQSVAFGPGAVASGNGSTAFSQGAQATAYQSFAMGFLSESTAESSLAFGSAAKAVSTRSSAFGYGSYAEGQQALAVGPSTSAIGFGTLAIGNGAFAQNESSIAIGSGTQSMNQSIALGLSCVSQGVRSFAIGNNIKTFGANEFSVGRYNASTVNASEDDPNGLIFSIGNGSTETLRSNAFEVKRNGDVAIKGNANVTGKITSTGGITVQPQGDLSMGEFTAGGL